MNDNSLSDKQDTQKRGSRRKARTRAELLAAARQVFVERGFHEAEHCRNHAGCRCRRGNLYLHFRDKDDAFQTLLEEGTSEIRENEPMQSTSTLMNL